MHWPHETRMSSARSGFGLENDKAGPDRELSESVKRLCPSTIVMYLYEVHWLEGGSKTGVC